METSNFTKSYKDITIVTTRQSEDVIKMRQTLILSSHLVAAMGTQLAYLILANPRSRAKVERRAPVSSKLKWNSWKSKKGCSTCKTKTSTTLAWCSLPSSQQCSQVPIIKEKYLSKKTNRLKSYCILRTPHQPFL